MVTLIHPEEEIRFFGKSQVGNFGHTPLDFILHYGFTTVGDSAGGGTESDNWCKIRLLDNARPADIETMFDSVNALCVGGAAKHDSGYSIIRGENGSACFKSPYGKMEYKLGDCESRRDQDIKNCPLDVLAAAFNSKLNSRGIMNYNWIRVTENGRPDIDWVKTVAWKDFVQASAAICKVCRAGLLPRR